jgi:hypothetical protein
MPDDQLEKVIDADSIAVLRRVVCLIDDSRRAEPPLDRAEFVATVRTMERLYSEGARSLGEAMNEAHACSDQRDAARARAAYERVIARCGSRFHRDIARLELKKLDTAAGER